MVDYAADFSKFKTYKWIPFESVGPIDNLTDDQIRAAVDVALAQKGLKRVDTDTADLFVDYQSREVSTTAHPIFPDPELPPSFYEGCLAINMYTPADHHLVWRGLASKALDPNANAEKRQKNLNKAVAKLLKNYPPKLFEERTAAEDYTSAALYSLIVIGKRAATRSVCIVGHADVSC